MSKVLKKVESSDVGVKDLKSDCFSMIQLVDSNTTSIKHIDQKLGQLLSSLNQKKNWSLPSNTIQNPKKDWHCMSITARSGKILINPICVGTKHEQVFEQDGREEDEDEHVDDLEDAYPISQPTRKKEREVKGNILLQMIPIPTPSFPQWLKKKSEDGKFMTFITML